MSEGIQGMKRSCYCGEVSLDQVGERLTLMGWTHRRRDHGGVIFVDLRDREGLVQVVFNPEIGDGLFRKAESIRNEYVLAVEGVVRPRPEGTVNDHLKTGAVEVLASELRLLNTAKTPPFYILDEVDVDENLRLKYRYLDLRRPEIQQTLIFRHWVVQAVRGFFAENRFLEIETPMLINSTPEGARDFLVPSRIHPGSFYALPQSPQIFKQILMISGFDRYYQIVRCFRDEDLRADRQPEFTQLDVEMSFIQQEDILKIMETMMARVFKQTLDVDIPLPLPQLTYEAAMERYGVDKPDTRFGMELVDLAAEVRGSDFKVFTQVLDNRGRVKGLNAKGCAGYSRKEIDDLARLAAVYGAKGLAYLTLTAEGIKSPIAKFFSEEALSAIVRKMDGQTGDILFFVADTPEVTAAALGHLRLELGRRLGLIDEDAFNFLWVVDFPLFEYDPEEKRYVAMHHPFTAPREDDLDLLETEPGRVRAMAYDMVLNGVEIGGGSIRVHRREVQERMFEALGFTRESAREKFGYLLEAFEYGAPPHGGIAFGIDRLVMLMARKDSIRDVIAFPKTQSAACLMSQAPGAVSAKQLKELRLQPMIEIRRP